MEILYTSCDDCRQTAAVCVLDLLVARNKQHAEAHSLAVSTEEFCVIYERIYIGGGDRGGIIIIIISSSSSSSSSVVNATCVMQHISTDLL